jgi:hypothetical protein
MTITACETGSPGKRASLDGELAMHFSCASCASCAPTTKEETATQGMSAIGTQARAGKVASIPDPLRLHREGSAIQSKEGESAATGANGRTSACTFLPTQIPQGCGSGRSRCFRSCLHSPRGWLRNARLSRSNRRCLPINYTLKWQKAGGRRLAKRRKLARRAQTLQPEQAPRVAARNCGNGGSV